MLNTTYVIHSLPLLFNNLLKHYLITVAGKHGSFIFSCQRDETKETLSTSNMFLWLLYNRDRSSRFQPFLSVFNTLLETKGGRWKMAVYLWLVEEEVRQYGFVDSPHHRGSISRFDNEDNVLVCHREEEERKKEMKESVLKSPTVWGCLMKASTFCNAKVQFGFGPKWCWCCYNPTNV